MFLEPLAAFSCLKEFPLEAHPSVSLYLCYGRHCPYERAWAYLVRQTRFQVLLDWAKHALVEEHGLKMRPSS